MSLQLLLLQSSSSITINDVDAVDDDYHRDWQESSFLCISTETGRGPEPGIPGPPGAPGGGPPGPPCRLPGPTGPFVGGPSGCWEGGFRLPGGPPGGPDGPGGPGAIR